MGINSHTIIILLSCVVILSYLFNMVSRKTNIPSVLLLIGTGIGVQYFSRYSGIPQLDVNKLVKILGAVGLIMIILEAALDLEVHKGKYKLIGNSFFSALFIFIISSFAIGFLIMNWLHESFANAFLYAVPLSIISSAIVIPSTSHLPEFKKEFIIYESSFSDIIGILVFNYMIMHNLFSLNTSLTFVGNVLLAIVISLASTLLLLYILSKTEVSVKFFLVFAILSMVYASGEIIHLPSLLIVLVFGLVLNNSPRVIRGRLRKWIPTTNLEGVLVFMKSITAETSFLIRTFFFIIFGYTIQLPMLILPNVWQIGSCIVLILLVVRFLYLRLILRANLFPELFLMPRGLVTILLFYSIPAEKSMSSFSDGILFFVVVLTSLLMMVGLLFFNKEKYKYYEREDKFV